MSTSSRFYLANGLSVRKIIDWSEVLLPRNRWWAIRIRSGRLAGRKIVDMQVTMIDENKYAETMTDVVLPALEQCRDEGWYDPSAAERSAGIEPLSGIMDTGGRSGQLHYLCYDSAKFDAIREQGATATFRGAIVISHGFTEFAEKYDELVWYFLLAGYSVCVLEHRGHGKSSRDVENPCMVWILSLIHI